MSGFTAMSPRRARKPVSIALGVALLAVVGLFLAVPASAALAAHAYDTPTYVYDAHVRVVVAGHGGDGRAWVAGGPVAVSWVNHAPVGRCGVAANTAGEAPYLYRGLAADHPALGDAANGVARPRGGHSDPALHNGGNTMSEFTSWTTEPSIARDIAAEANGPGTVLRTPNADGPGYVRVPSPDVYGEKEVLIRGPVTGADVLPWEP